MPTTRTTTDRNGYPIGSAHTVMCYRRHLARIAATRAMIEMGGQVRDLKMGEVLKALKAQGLKPFKEMHGGQVPGLYFVGTSAQDSRWRIREGIEADLDRNEADFRELLPTHLAARD